MFGFVSKKTMAVITAAVSDERLEYLAERDVDMVLDAVPQPFDVTITAGVLEAMMIAVARGGVLTHDDLLDMIVEAGLEPRVLYPHGFRRKGLLRRRVPEPRDPEAAGRAVTEGDTVRNPVLGELLARVGQLRVGARQLLA